MDINRRAPVIASAESLIHAPLDLVWTVLTDIESWPNWNPDVARVELSGPLTPGSVFRWKAGGAPIVSTIREVIPGRHLVWTGRLPGIQAIHLWSFEERQQGVEARTEESFEGLLVRLLRRPMRRMLAASLKAGMEALKAECERRTGTVAM